MNMTEDKTMTWADLQSWCDDLSSWIIELGEEDEVRKAWPKGIFPLVVNQEKDEIDEDQDVLAYITVWMCCKLRTRAPANIEARMIFCKFKGPWQEIYFKLIKRFENNLDFRDIDIFGLAG